MAALVNHLFVCADQDRFVGMAAMLKLLVITVVAVEVYGE